LIETADGRRGIVAEIATDSNRAGVVND